MRIDSDWSGLSKTWSDIEKEIGKVTREAVNTATLGLKQELRQQVRLAGLGPRLANTWQSKLYKNDADGMDTAGYVYSKAPDIIYSFESGATIRPRGGKRYLWLPTRSVPRARGVGRATSTKRMTPQEVEREYKQPLIVRSGRGNHMLAFIKRERGLTPTGKLRKVRKGRRGIGDTGELVLMFTLVPTTKRDKVLDIDGAAARWADAVPRLVDRAT